MSSSAAIRCGVGSVTVIANKDTIDKYNQKFFSLLKIEINSIDELKFFLKKNINYKLYPYLLIKKLLKLEKWY